MSESNLHDEQRGSDDTQPEQPIVAKLVGQANGPDTASTDRSIENPDSNDSAGESIRVGSPFAADPGDLPDATLPVAPKKIEAFYDVGPIRYTAIGAVAAAVMTLGFAAAAAWWFPGGGTLIAGLGCVLSIFGLYSPHKMYAFGCLTLHLCLFLVSYTHAIMLA